MRLVDLVVLVEVKVVVVKARVVVKAKVKVKAKVMVMVMVEQKRPDNSLVKAARSPLATREDCKDTRTQMLPANRKEMLSELLNSRVVDVLKCFPRWPISKGIMQWVAFMWQSDCAVVHSSNIKRFGHNRPPLILLQLF